MKIEIQGDLIASGEYRVSNVGVHLIVNCHSKVIDLDYLSVSGDVVMFAYSHEDVKSTITFICEHEAEVELLQNTRRFDSIDRYQWEFLFIKFERMYGEL